MPNDRESSAAERCRTEAELTDCPDERTALIALARAIEAAEAAARELAARSRRGWSTRLVNPYDFTEPG